MKNELTSPPKQLHILIEPAHGWMPLNLIDLWQYRDLFFFLAWRDIKVRYKQTLLGASWAVLQPLLTMLIFSFIFGKLAGLPSEGIPYPVFTYTALLPWQLFAFALSQSSNSLVGSQQLVSKVYFPRLIIPIASVAPGVIDFVISFVVLIGLMVYFKIQLTTRLFALPLLLLLALLTALAVGLWLSALNVEYRDVRYVVPFLTQVWMYATPVAYSSTLIPEKWRWLYGLNPLTGVVESFRWAVLGKGESLASLFWVSVVMIFILLVSGLFYFRRMEDTFADVI